MKKSTLLAMLLFGFAILVVSLGFLWKFYQPSSISVIDRDTTIAGDFSLDAGKILILRNGAKLTVEGDLRIQGDLRCEGGSLRVIGKKNVELSGSIRCGSVAKSRREEELESESSAVEVGMVVHGSLAMNTGSVIESSGNVQIVGSEGQLVAGAKLDELYNDISQPTGNGIRVGPMTGGAQASTQKQHIVSRAPFVDISQHSSSHSSFGLIPVAEAEAPLRAILSGKIVVGTAPQSGHQILVVDLPQVSQLVVQDLQIDGPDGHRGMDDLQKNCYAVGKDGGDALRLLVVAPNVTVHNFTLKLGAGGAGGDAETKQDCDLASAQGGRGGQPGNFKMIAGEKFEITGVFTIIPGAGGAGGWAKASSKDATSSSARGGSGADITQQLSFGGTVGGMENIKIVSSLGGNGGDGCPPGSGGSGGSGKLDGNNGAPGVNMCQKPTPSADAAATNTPRPTLVATPTIATEKPTDRAIEITPTLPQTPSPSSIPLEPTPTDRPTPTPNNVPLYIPLEPTPTPTPITTIERATPTPASSKP